MNLRRFLVGALALLALSAVIACGDAEIREVEVVKVVEKEVPVEVIKEVAVEKIKEVVVTEVVTETVVEEVEVEVAGRRLDPPTGFGGSSPMALFSAVSPF